MSVDDYGVDGRRWSVVVLVFPPVFVLVVVPRLASFSIAPGFSWWVVGADGIIMKGFEVP